MQAGSAMTCCCAAAVHRTELRRAGCGMRCCGLGLLAVADGSSWGTGVSGAGVCGG